ncbi:MAG: iron ABC transporter permease [Hyphomicrobiaceae bacterium]
MRRSNWIWLAVGATGFALLPWYLTDLTGLSGWPLGRGGSALALALSGTSTWLLPLALVFAIAAYAMRPTATAEQAGRWLVAASLAGLVWFWLQGFAIGHRGWGIPGLATILGAPGPSQPGMGYGAFLACLALLMLFCHGLAARGFCRGDAFVTCSIGLILGLVVLFVFFPIAKMLVSAVQDNDGRFAPLLFLAKFFDRSIWGLSCLTSSVSCGVAWNTLVLGALVGFGTTALGLAFALIVTRTSFPAKGLLRALTVLPIITPPFVIGLAVILLFGRTGAVTAFVSDMLEIARSRWIYGLPGVFLAQMLAFTPIAFLVLIGVVQAVSPSLEEASSTLRASRWTTFTTVSLPLMRPGLANAFLLGFIESMADFGNPLVLGGNFEVLSTKIFFAVVGAANDQSQAAVLSIILLAFTLAVFWIQQRWLGRVSYTTVSGKGDSGLPTPLPRRVAWACYLTALPWAVLTIVIYATILVGGFVKSIGRDYTPTLEHLLTGFSVEWGTTGLYFSGSAWDSFWTTVQVSAIAAPLTAAIGILTAYLLTRQQFAGRRSFEFVTMLSFAIPGTVVGVSYILAFNVPPVEVTGTGLILVICFVFRNMPVGVRSGIATLAQIDRSLDEASATLRARTGTTMWYVVLPLLRPAIVASLVYAFVRAMTAVSAVIFLVSAEYNMATAYIVGRVEAGEFGLAIAYSSVLIFIMLGAIGLIQLVVGERKLGRRAGQPLVMPASA